MILSIHPVPFFACMEHGIADEQNCNVLFIYRWFNRWFSIKSPNSFRPWIRRTKIWTHISDLTLILRSFSMLILVFIYMMCSMSESVPAARSWAVWLQPSSTPTTCPVNPPKTTYFLEVHVLRDALLLKSSPYWDDLESYLIKITPKIRQFFCQILSIGCKCGFYRCILS